MSEIETNIPTIPPQSAFSDLMVLAKLMADPRGLEKNLKEFAAAVAKFEAAKAGAEKAEVAAAKAQSELAAQTARDRAELAAEKEALAIEKAAVNKRYEKIEEAWSEVDREKSHLKMALMRFAGLTQHPLQSERSLESVENEVYAGARDAHYGDDSVNAVTELVAQSSEGTLTRTTRNNRPPRPVHIDR
jgi:oligoendopeptidase F